MRTTKSAGADNFCIWRGLPGGVISLRGRLQFGIGRLMLHITGVSKRRISRRYDCRDPAFIHKRWPSILGKRLLRIASMSSNYRETESTCPKSTVQHTKYKKEGKRYDEMKHPTQYVTIVVAAEINIATPNLETFVKPVLGPKKWYFVISILCQVVINVKIPNDQRNIHSTGEFRLCPTLSKTENNPIAYVDGSILTSMAVILVLKGVR